MQNQSRSNLPRQQLYERVWATPMLRLAKEFGISSVALSKRCRKLNIPTPGRGYWAKRAIGVAMPIPPLPPEVTPPPPQAISAGYAVWPDEVAGLCERAQLLLASLRRGERNAQGLVAIEDPSQVRITVSKALAEKTARVFHALLVSIENTGALFCKSRRRLGPAYFDHPLGRLNLIMEEFIEELIPKRRSWRPPKEVPSGRIVITLQDEYGRWKSSWQEGEDGNIREIVTKAASAVTRHYRDVAEEQAEKAERRRIENERWERQEEARKKAAHEEALKDTARTRAEDLFWAVEWARLYELGQAFIQQCAARWSEAGTLSRSQQEWLHWARETFESWSPWKCGYPDPNRDGSFDPHQVPFGGPYPATRKFPRPPTMPELKAEVPNFFSQSASGYSGYPYWLRHLK